MNAIIEQAKQYFIGKDYTKGLEMISAHVSEISKEQIGFAYDLAGCCCFMLNSFPAANNYFSQAILRNPKIIQFQINKGATLRKLGLQAQAVNLFEELTKKSSDPAIYYNLKLMKKTNKQIQAMICHISQFQECNKRYDVWDGLTPYFLKGSSTRSDFIYNHQQKIINSIKTPKNKDMPWRQYFKKLMDDIVIRELQCTYSGIKLTELGQVIIPVIKNMNQMYSDIETKIKFNDQRQMLQDKFAIVMDQIQQNPNQADKIYSQNTINLIEQIKILNEKQVHGYNNWQSFCQSKKQSVLLCERAYKIKGTESPEMQIAITEDKFLIYINPQFKRDLSLNKTIKLISSKKINQTDMRFVANLFWFTFLRTMFCGEEGIDLNLLKLHRMALIYLYQQADLPDNLKFSKQQFPEIMMHICKKYNQMYTVDFIPDIKRQMIFKNCIGFKNYLSQVDRFFCKAIENDKWFKKLTEDGKQCEQFHIDYSITDSLKDKVAQNLSILFYHFRNQSKPGRQHLILALALQDMLNETKLDMNGKDSFFFHYNQPDEPKQEATGLIQKVLGIINWNKS